MHRILALVLTVLTGAAVAGVILTSQRGVQTRRAVAAGEAGAEALVDTQSLSTAQQLAPLAGTPDEQALAQEALRAADREVDLAFAMALEAADEEPAPRDEKTRALQERVGRRQERLQEAQARVAELTRLAAKATGGRKDLLQDQLEEAQAWEDVAQNALDDAKIDLQRAGGDKHAQIQQMEDEHNATERQGASASNTAGAKATTATQSAPASTARLGGLLGQVQQWAALRAERKALQSAQRQARVGVARLKQEHDDLAQRVKFPAGETPAPGESIGAPASKEEATARLALTKQLTNLQKRLLGLNRRARLEDELAGIYSQWDALVAERALRTMHAILLSLLVILLIALVVVAGDAWLARFFSGIGPERVRILTIRRVVRVALETAGVIVVLLIVFGPPGQLVVLLGFAGAGLTIALKDFIVGFFGWFVLMGKDGMRVGDWVEINGVTGEVVDIGPLHTVLLETGNWTDAGHPTGRRVTFVNSFAIEKHFFNFSTSGQWLWDEVVATLPPGRDPYPIADAIQKVVAKETEQTARLAEQEWTKAGSARGLRGFSAAPAITVRPGPAGLEIAVRYVTRANERYALRARLFQAMVELLGGKSPAPTSA